jgi:thiamine-monophosphate kinase
VTPSRSEFELIERHFARPPRDASVRVGIGDDAAILAPTPGSEIVVSVDMLVEGRHFFAGTDAQRLGHKTLAVNLSDLAAMGARPRYALLAGALPDRDDAWIAAFMSGFRSLADRYAVELVGGDTTRGPRNLCVTIIGEVPAGSALLRSGARPGDDVYVSGTLGDAALAVATLNHRVTLAPEALAAVRARLECPQPRVELGMRLRGIASAALDVSDGLTGDLQHILDRSGVGATLQLDALPRDPVLDALLRGADRDLALSCLLAGGDDYELCFTAPVTQRATLDALAAELALPLTRIGVIDAQHGLRVLDGGEALPQLPRAFDHFA